MAPTVLGKPAYTQVWGGSLTWGTCWPSPAAWRGVDGGNGQKSLWRKDLGSHLSQEFLIINIAFRLFCLGKMNCIICQIEKAWCFPRQVNKLVVKRDGRRNTSVR